MPGQMRVMPRVRCWYSEVVLVPRVRCWYSEVVLVLGVWCFCSECGADTEISGAGADR